MATWQEFTLQSVKLALFTPDHGSFASGRTVRAILQNHGEQFDGEMQTLPIPTDMPPEIPRVTLQSADGRKQLNVAPARFDYIWNSNPELAPLPISEVVRECVELLTAYIEEMRLRVGRLGLIIDRACPHEAPAQFLVERFCKAETQREPFNRSTTFEIHNHKVYSPPHGDIDYAINSWVRCRSAVLVDSNRPAIVVIQDLNTMAEDMRERRFTPSQVHAFFGMAAIQIEEILRKYFPG